MSQLPSIYTVGRTATGYQPLRNGRPHFEEFADYLSAHLACKVAENRQAVRYQRAVLASQAPGKRAAA